MLRLNDRDHAIIEYLKVEGWALSTQLSDRFFNGSRHSCSNRLRQLSKNAIIETLPFSIFKESYWHERGVLNLFCDLSGRTKVYRLGIELREGLGRRYQRASSDFMLAHQILLGAVRERLERIFPQALIVSEASEALRHQYLAIGADEMPDLVVEIDGIKLSVELERKARRGLSDANYAYEDRFENLALRYDLVLYVIEREDHLGPLLRKAQGLSRVGLCSILNLNEIFVCGKSLLTLKAFVEEAKSKSLEIAR